jgi:CheY-like chemotaxis protein
MHIEREIHEPQPANWSVSAPISPTPRLATGKRVLLAEDDPALRTLITESLRRDGHQVTSATNAAELWFILRDAHFHRQAPGPFDVLLTDQRMPLGTGLSVVEILRAVDPSLPVILITAFGDAELHAAARSLNVSAVFDKPFDLDDLRTALLILADRKPRRRP